MASTAGDRDALKKAAEIISRRARVISSAFSRRIPAATTVKDYNGEVAVVTDGHHAPNAAPFEGGEHHPDWGSPDSISKGARTRYEDHKDWSKQPYRPYMLEAAYDKLDAAAEAYAESIDDELRRHGWK